MTQTRTETAETIQSLVVDCHSKFDEHIFE